MPALGSNLSTVKDAESTDLSSLLNVLEWIKDAAFLGKTRVNVDLVRELRSQVRNTWAHAPQQELTDDEKAEGFSIATDFLKDLENVCPNDENSNCLEHLKYLNTNEVTSSVFECELQSLLLQRHLLDNIKEEIKTVKTERSSDKKTIEEHQQKLEKLKCALNEWSQKMGKIESFKENINEQFNNFAEELKSFRGIPDDIREIRQSIGQIRDDFAKMNKPQKVEPVPTSCLPDKLVNFTGREAEIKKIIALLIDEQNAVVSLHGGPGFGKTAIAIQVSHKLSEDHMTPVVFSQFSTVTTVDEMIQQLCLDVGVNHEGKPKQSLILWLKNKKKVILIMDDIDNLLEDKTSFYEFVRLLRRSSNQQCQIVTTSRMSFEIPELSACEVQVDEMDDESCMELLKKKCPQKDDEFLGKLAEICGKIPLALSIAGSRVKDFDDSNELLQHLKKQPMKAFKRFKSDQFVNKAINMSYEKCSNEEQEMFIRLSVFEGSFDKFAAKAVIEKGDLETTDVLQNLVSRSLIKESTESRYSIHLLIKHFLEDKQKTGDEKAERARAQAEVLMVEYYLELGHQLMKESYSKDGYKKSREDLKQEASNIQNVLKICCQQEDPTSSDIPDCLARSKIYTISARLFSVFVRTITPAFIVDEFLQRCANLAKEKKQHAIKLNFDCLLVAEKRYNTIGKSDEDFISKMEKIKKEFETHYDDLKNDKSLCAHYYYQDGRYLLRKSENQQRGKQLNLRIDAREQLEKSLKLRETLADTPEGKADKIFALLQLGNAFKKKSKSNNSIEQAQTYYEEAIQLSQDNLGDHALTSSCYKHLGDLLLTMKKHKFAEKEYNTAKIMRENLGLDASKGYVFLLNNLGACLTESKRAHEAIEVLEKARDMAEKLAENNEPTVCKTKVYTTLAIAYDLVQNDSEAVSYANKALEFEEAMNKGTPNKLRKILSKKH